MSFGLACAVLVSKNKKIIFSFIFGFLTGPIALVYYLIRKEAREGLPKTKEQEFVEEKFSKIAKGAGKFGSKLLNSKAGSAVKKPLIVIRKKIGVGPVVKKKS